MKWLDELMALEEGRHHIRCPSCGSTELDSGFVLIDKKERLCHNKWLVFDEK